MMSGATGKLVGSLALLEQAREDVYFSRLDRELIDALHRKFRTSTKGADKWTGAGMHVPENSDTSRH